MAPSVSIKKIAQAGFTLIEMMVVVALIGILAAIAYPNYMEYIVRTYRTEGMALLNDAAARQERYFAQNSKYVTDSNNINSLGLLTTSASGYYLLSVSKVSNDGGYTLTATPQGSQALRDKACGFLTLDAKGTKGSEKGSLDRCWR